MEMKIDKFINFVFAEQFKIKRKEVFIDIRTRKLGKKEFFERKLFPVSKLEDIYHIFYKQAYISDVYYGVHFRYSEREYIEESDIVYVDVDGSIDQEFFNKTKIIPTIVQTSNSGFHLYFKLENPVSKADWLIISKIVANYIEIYLASGKIDYQVSSDFARILRIPNTLNSKKNFFQVKILNISENRINPFKVLGFAKNYSGEIENLDEFLHLLTKSLDGSYTKGNRNNIVFGLSGLLKKKKIKFDIAKEVINYITDYFHDEEKNSRLRVLYRTYYEVQNVKAFSILKEYIKDFSFLDLLERNYSEEINLGEIKIINDLTRRRLLLVRRKSLITLAYFCIVEFTPIREFFVRMKIVDIFKKVRQFENTIFYISDFLYNSHLLNENFYKTFLEIMKRLCFYHKNLNKKEVIV
ncbi:MAG: hypothetical protein RMJ67_01405 [Elusimicrobiota bacterium]|nr:hypothetical protein [Endomicrobiia bacterium]MDW8165161.1 hypothetical protein [Elusimicrobiota bacterium]